MSYTKHKYVVATKRAGQGFNMLFACDDYQLAQKTFNNVSGCEQVRIYIRAQWNGERSHYRMHSNLVENTAQISSSVGMMLINQADSTCF